jgi:RimJ/RimL family protein N-acetyltransferase
VLVSIETTWLKLRTLGTGDVDRSWLGWASDPAVMGTLNTQTREMGLDQLRAYVGSFDNLRRNLIGIFDRRDGTLAGIIVLEVDTFHFLGSIHLMIGNKRYWGRRLPQEVGFAIVRHCFEERGLEKLMFMPLADNFAAIAVCLAWKLRLEGTLRAHRRSVTGGPRLDQLQFAITREEYLARLAAGEGPAAGA